MNLIHEYALLALVLLPVAVIVAMNVWLALEGERDTLLVPAPRPYPTIPMPDQVESTPAQGPAVQPQPVTDEPLREAA